jgi:hypothetical protein
MSPAETTQLAKLWAMYAAYYRVKLEDHVLRMYADDLSDLDFGTARGALEQYRKNPKNKFMPMPAQVREILDPQVDADAAAKEIASRIMAAIPKFGSWRRDEAFAYIGPIGAEIVGRYGGWQRLCENLGDSLDVGTFQAQARDIARAQFQYGPGAIEQAVLNPASHEPRGQIQSAKEILNLIQSKGSQHD